jgi:hypothetical protein
MTRLPLYIIFINYVLFLYRFDHLALVKNPQIMHKAQLELREAFKGQYRLTEDDMVKLRCSLVFFFSSIGSCPVAPSTCLKNLR